jgi:midasin (ATPase involved in ribosome maturation)
MLTCFNAETTPLMKLLTSIEFLLSKLEEWENTYASKRLNSVETEINSLKMLVIRYRKIQILSWRNLLTWKRNRHINEDFGNCIRLAHTIERQVFELKDDVSKIFDLLDLYIRDSSLGLFETRLSFLLVLRNHLTVK